MKFQQATIAAISAMALSLSTETSAFTSPRAFTSATSCKIDSRIGIASSEVTEVVSTDESNMPRKKSKEERLEAAKKGLQVHVVGLSIHHAEVEVREKLAIPEPEWNSASQDLCADGRVAEAAVLSTCNRFEVYYAASDAREAAACVTDYLAKRSGVPVRTLRRNLFMLSGDDAVWHVMRVSGGLDSLVVGEGQILSQVRQCHLHSIEPEGRGGKVLSRMLNTAVAAGKRVRSETAISKGSVSISSAAVELTEMMCMDDLNIPFSEARLAVVGAGKMTRLLITHLASRGLEKITIVNRSVGRPQELQEQFPDVEIEIKLMDDLWDVVGRSDVVFTATSSVDYVVDAPLLKENGLAGGRPLMLVDISVPRNVAEDCKDIPNVAAYNVDDLKAVVAKNTAMRQREMIEAENLLREEADAYTHWRDSLRAIPTINSLQERAEEFRQQEIKKATRIANGFSEKEMEAVERLSRGIVNKLLHGPMSHLRKTDGSSAKELRDMFQLDAEGRNKKKNERRR